MLDQNELRRAARRSATNASRQQLIEILSTKGTYPVEVYAACRDELIERYPCSDCGAPAGRWCYPDYGCSNSDRRPAITRRDTRMGSIMLQQLRQHLDW